MVEKIAGIPAPPSVGGGGTGATGATGKDFESFIQEAGTNAIDTMYKGENLAMQGITGDADLTDVVAAVASAESTLQTITGLRDKMMQAYQEILRMPI